MFKRKTLVVAAITALTVLVTSPFQPMIEFFYGAPNRQVTYATPKPSDANLPNSYTVATKVFIDDILARKAMVDVRSFGAKGDGITDDTDAIETALKSIMVAKSPEENKAIY